MPTFHVERSILIDAPLDPVRELVRDFRHWPRWSPWLVMEPEARLDFPPDGKSYTWDGRVIGKGCISLDVELPDRLTHTVLFIKPFRSSAVTGFEFAESGSGTIVKWSMRGKLPFFLFFMKRMMSAWIGSDYDRGLLMLKDLAETGEVLSSLASHGVEPVAAIDYVGIRNQCLCSDIGTKVRRDFGRLGEWLEANSLAPAGPMFSIYHKWDLVRDAADYTCAVPMPVAPEPLPEGFERGTVPAGRAYVMVHTGAYRHLGNAWAAGMARARARIYQPRRGEAPLEIYRNTPEETAEGGLVTEIRIPAR